MEETDKCVAIISGKDIYYKMYKVKIIIGRNSANGIVDIDIGKTTFVSREHLELLHTKNVLKVRCLGKNGIFVDDQFKSHCSTAYEIPQRCVLRFPSTNIKLLVKYTGENNDGSPTQTLTYPAKKKALIGLSASDAKSSSLFNTQSDYDIANGTDGRIYDARSNNNLQQAMESNVSSIPASNPSSHSILLSDSNASSLYSRKASSPCHQPVILKDKKDLSMVPSNSDEVKPPFSYAQLIVQAILSVEEKQLTLSGIYAFISQHYPYYKVNDKGWQNSIRHNLSLNRYFIKVARSQEESGKGCFWRVDPHYESRLGSQAYRMRTQRRVHLNVFDRDPISSDANTVPQQSFHQKQTYKTYYMTPNKYENYFRGVNLTNDDPNSQRSVSDAESPPPPVLEPSTFQLSLNSVSGVRSDSPNRDIMDTAESPSQSFGSSVQITRLIPAPFSLLKQGGKECTLIDIGGRIYTPANQPEIALSPPPVTPVITSTPSTPVLVAPDGTRIVVQPSSAASTSKSCITSLATVPRFVKCLPSGLVTVPKSVSQSGSESPSLSIVQSNTEASSVTRPISVLSLKRSYTPPVSRSVVPSPIILKSSDSKLSSFNFPTTCHTSLLPTTPPTSRLIVNTSSVLLTSSSASIIKPITPDSTTTTASTSATALLSLQKPENESNSVEISNF